jgi:hypothetical protein
MLINSGENLPLPKLPLVQGRHFQGISSNENRAYHFCDHPHRDAKLT